MKRLTWWGVFAWGVAVAASSGATQEKVNGYDEKILVANRAAHPQARSRAEAVQGLDVNRRFPLSPAPQTMVPALPEAVHNLFAPFFSSKLHGQGIWLTLVQELLAAHGLKFGLERLESGGTRFTIGFEEAG